MKTDTARAIVISNGAPEQSETASTASMAVEPEQLGQLQSMRVVGGQYSVPIHSEK